jgi:hypothetical protein
LTYYTTKVVKSRTAVYIRRGWNEDIPKYGCAKYCTVEIR